MSLARIALAVAILTALTAAPILTGIAAPSTGPATPTVTPSTYGRPTWKARP